MSRQSKNITGYSRLTMEKEKQSPQNHTCGQPPSQPGIKSCTSRETIDDEICQLPVIFIYLFQNVAFVIELSLILEIATNDCIMFQTSSLSSAPPPPADFPSPKCCLALVSNSGHSRMFLVLCASLCMVTAVIILLSEQKFRVKQDRYVGSWVMKLTDRLSCQLAVCMR